MDSKSKSNLPMRLFKFFIPIIIGFAVIIITGLVMQEGLRIKFWPLVTAYFFPPLGKETIIPAGLAAGINPIFMALSIAFVDIIVSLFLIWNYDLVKKIPILHS